MGWCGEGGAGVTASQGELFTAMGQGDPSGDSQGWGGDLRFPATLSCPQYHKRRAGFRGGNRTLNSDFPGVNPALPLPKGMTLRLHALVFSVARIVSL